MPFGIGIEHVKSEVNIAALLRSAYNLGAAFLFTVGRRYEPRAPDTTQAYRHLPVWHFLTWDAYWAQAPYDWVPVAVELAAGAVGLEEYQHPKRCVYWLGAEDGGLASETVAQARDVIQIPSRFCLNVATAGAIVMYDRLAKQLLGAGVPLPNADIDVVRRSGQAGRVVRG